MKKIRIVSIPGGQAPEEIRKAWIGVEIPVDASVAQPSTQDTGGVLVRGDHPVAKCVYTVSSLDAFEALMTHDYSAYTWWQQNATGLFLRGRHLLFDESACELFEDTVKFTCYHEGCEGVEIEGKLGCEATSELYHGFVARGGVGRIRWDPTEPVREFALEGSYGEHKCPKCNSIFVSVIIAVTDAGGEVCFGYESEGC